jgi:hypothetical protein
LVTAAARRTFIETVCNDMPNAPVSNTVRGYLNEQLTPDDIRAIQRDCNRASTIIRFHLSKSSFVTLKIYDLRGDEIETLIRGECSAGEHEVKWRTAGMASGIYLYRLQSGDDVETKQLVLLKSNYCMRS